MKIISYTGNLILFNASIKHSNGIITTEEYNLIKELINSSDKDNYTIAWELIKSKALKK